MHTERFSGRVADYERYRLRYPTDRLLELLRDWCALKPDQLVADVGAGTGMLAEVFLSNGNSVIAIEPNADMRASCERLAESRPKLRVIDATAEKTGLDAGSVDFVSVGRAFHWFDRERGIAEFRRILIPQGWIVFVSQGRARDGSEQAQAYEKLLIEHGSDYSELRPRYRAHEHLEELFPGGEVRKEKIDGEERLSLEELVGQTMSFSVAPLPGHPKHDGMIRALGQFYDRFAHNGKVTLQTACWMTCARF